MEGDSHLNLRWDDHTVTFVHLLNHFRLQELYCDASLACAGGGVYPVHKVVLSACSDFFASIFASASCQNPVVVLQDVATDHLESLLTYIYRGEVLLARNDLPAFLKVAESLQVKGLAPPPLIPLSRDTWGGCEGVPPPHDPPGSTSTQQPIQTHSDPQQYSHLEMVTPSPARSRVPWEAEGVSRSGVHLQTASRNRGSTHGDEDRLRPPRKRFSPHFANTEKFGGTFQNLVASEEGGIKEEPIEEDGPDYFDSGRLTIYEEEEEEMEEMEEEEVKEERPNDEGERRVPGKAKEEEERIEGRKEDGVEEEEEEEDEEDEDTMDVKIMLDTRQHPTLSSVNGSNTFSCSTHSPSPSLSTHSLPHSHHTHSPTPSQQTPSPSLSVCTLSPTAQHGTSPTPLSPTLAHSPITAAPPTITSQLRRELLKPLQQYRVPHHPHQPHQTHPSIPHPVIASREDGGVLDGVEVPREPPPLVKIRAPSPTLHQFPQPYRRHNHHHFQQLRQSDGRDNPTNTTTITTTPPFTLSSTTTTTTTPNKSHHLLVTTQPTYRARLPHLTTLTPPAQPEYMPIAASFKHGHQVDTDTPLNLSQDTNNSQHRHRAIVTASGDQEHHTRDGDPFLGKILTNRKRRMRGPKSWEYLVRLLRDPSTNPSLIRWENEMKGVFRLVQPAVIAQRWGRRTGKHASECLSYENFARGLRYHYATGALEPVSERSFVYKFGPKAQLALGDGEYAVNTSSVSPAVVAAAAAAMTQI